MNHRDLLAALVACGLAATTFILADGFAPDARTFPQIISGVMFLCGLVILARTLMRRTPEIDEERVEAVEPRVLIVIALTIAYIFGIAFLGYIASSLIFIPVVSIWLGFRRWVTVAAVSVLIAFGVSYMFEHLFLTPLPTGAVWAWL